MVKFNSVRGNKLVAGRMYVAQIWATRNRREVKLVRVTSITAPGKIKDGVKVRTDAFAATTIDGVLTTMHEGKLVRVTFGTVGTQMLALPAPATAREEVKQVIERAARKPLTAEQKARKNELARARRAAARAAA